MAPPESATNLKAYPRISIVTASYNQASFLEETIRSILLQNYPNLEYIIMDGGSTDGSVDIIRHYEKHLAYWTTEKDEGAADAYRKGFEQATGSIFAYINSDDFYLPGAFHHIAEVFDKTRADVVYGDMHWVNRDAEIVAERRQTPFTRLGFLYGGSDMSQPSTFWTDRIYRDSGGMDPSFQFAFDLDMFGRFMASNANFIYTRRFISKFRMHSAQKTDVINHIGRQETRKIRQRYARFSATSLAGVFLRNVARAQRIIWYIRQGDLMWLISRVPDRLLSHTSAAQAAGPRSKWMG
jgi:glycosyltransferase involved in cell wall biosynthesis